MQSLSGVMVAFDDAKALSKGDRLPLQAIARAPELSTDELAETNARHQAGLLALKNAAAGVTAPALAPDGGADEVVSWHWREGAKIVRRRRSP
jgi:hypothetical protein